MGSLRNPIGPLPSAVYWRRRFVVLAIALLLILLLLWAVNLVLSGGSGGGAQDNGKGPASGPATAITPGPTDNPSATISDRPGGRDDLDENESESEGADADGDGDADGADGGKGAGGGSGGSGTDGEDVSGDGAVGGLRVCAAEDLKLSLRSARNEYAPGTRPKITLTVSNTAATACAVDFAPTATVITISDVDDTTVWSSDHCPTGQDARTARVPAGGTASHTVRWKRERSAENCATPDTKAVAAGTYLVEARLRGLTAQTSFVLAKD